MTQAQPFTILLPYLPNKIANKIFFPKLTHPVFLFLRDQ